MLISLLLKWLAATADINEILDNLKRIMGVGARHTGLQFKTFGFGFYFKCAGLALAFKTLSAPRPFTLSNKVERN